MTRTTTATVAVAADYADAMLTARRAKNWLFILLMLILLAQIAVFFCVRFKVLKLEDQFVVNKASVVTTSQPTTDASIATTEPTPAAVAVVTTPMTNHVSTADILRYVIPILDFLGITLGIVLAIVLLLIALIMLVGRLIGVSHVTGAFIWCVLLVVFLFPWQSFLVSGPHHTGETTVSASDSDQPSFKIPGVLYTWPELVKNYNFSSEDPGKMFAVILGWARFAGLPILAVLMLLSVQAKSARGLKFALGEADVQVELTSATM